MSAVTLCPRCQQDYPRNYLLESTHEPLLVCPECDATWLGGTTPTLSTFTDYEEFMAARGLGYYFDGLRRLP